MNEFQLRVRGCGEGRDADILAPVFIWDSAASGMQFTVEMAKDSDFRNIIFLRDTKEHYCVYDSVPLCPGRRYYVRVRGGIGPWSMMSFVTEDM